MEIDGLVPPTGGGTGNNAPPRPTTRITCEFCQCAVGPDGAYLAMSDKARGYRDQAEKLEQVRAELATAKARISALESENAELKRPAPVSQSGRW